jgi:pyruvate dehydrogenase E1 component alpha subunit
VEQRKAHHDPIEILRDRLMDAGLLDQAALEEMDGEVRSVVDEAVEFADSSPRPGPEALYSNVWADINPNGRLNFDGRGESPWR